MIRRRKLPKYRLHRPSGQAVVTFSGKDFYLGAYDSEVSRAEYDRLVAEWLVCGRKLPPSDQDEPGMGNYDGKVQRLAGDDLCCDTMQTFLTFP